jgi:hypothetical protein
MAEPRQAGDMWNFRGGKLIAKAFWDVTLVVDGNNICVVWATLTFTVEVFHIYHITRQNTQNWHIN